MLTDLFSRQTCADCKWCCCFDQSDQWETPLIVAGNVAELRSRFPEAQFAALKTDYKLSLSFLTDNPKEYIFCPFLNHQTGCMLSETEKPFDCKIWPLRIMRKENRLVITLTPTCPACKAVPVETLVCFVEKSLGKTIQNYAERHPDMILPYREGYSVLMECRAAE